MIERIDVCVIKETNPYTNLALEQYLTESVLENQVILYLWQNKNTVVIGKNQNAWAECKIDLLTKDGGLLARRSSGGGAVYHDLGNLNFTFAADNKNYDVDKQLSVILNAVNRLGVCAEKSGRNDLVINSKKFSGNAFVTKGNKSCHHGTVMLNVDIEKLTKYLNVSESKLRSKGVSSVKSRVCNLADYDGSINADNLSKLLIEEFENVYGLRSGIIAIEPNKFDAILDKYSSWDWIYGRKIPFSYEINNKLSFGELTAGFAVNGGIIQDVQFFSDALDSWFISQLPNIVRGCSFIAESISAALLNFQWETDLQIEYASEIAEWLNNSIGETDYGV